MPNTKLHNVKHIFETYFHDIFEAHFKIVEKKIKIMSLVFSMSIVYYYYCIPRPMPITTKVVSSNPIHGKVYSIQHYVIKFVSDLRQVGGFSGYSSFLHQ